MSRDRDLERRAYRLFAELFSLSPAERLARLDTDSANDPALRREVEALLAADSDESWLLDGQAAALVGDGWSGEPEAADSTLGPGAVVGTYRLERELGVGGMGRVYEARRADGTLDRPVAVKVLKAEGWQRGDRERRFLDEGRALASLQHRHIARVFEAGIDAEVGPYLVMERVDGRAITEVCQRHDLDLGARVDLMLAVCDAVSAAHDQRLVHRDLKPSNVLVDRRGQVKLLDFGIAHFLDRPLGEESARLPMTPAYAAPEQARGDAITPATDVYALGLLLYEVLTGQRAVDLRDATPGEIARRIDESDPPLPSLAFGDGPADTSTPLARLRRQLRGDLDTIVMKALRKQPAQRYASARALGDDLRRWRYGRPVVARPAGSIERAWKFARRHRLAVTAAALVAAILISSAAYFAVQRRHADAARVLAERETATAEQISELMRWLFEASSPSEALGVDAPAADLLASGVERVEANASPAVRADLYLVLARAYANLGFDDDARATLERARQAGRDAERPELVATVEARLHELDRTTAP
ncbi:MAG: serine/threonine-protein kinase [Acidobacteriota bacterium]